MTKHETYTNRKTRHLRHPIAKVMRDGLFGWHEPYCIEVIAPDDNQRCEEETGKAKARIQ